ncbi:hypothetical protein FALBO_7952 [Fusarium albosuccineum]|uniref:Uncharacterized protein n=1 Tax=Fusarium albosuccineum TaxID=1237068 RepID=A0A8H4LBP1_9HYPO|nr:hypothetical protein FALBO_7952 [Fusarium albosuccineum]
MFSPLMSTLTSGNTRRSPLEWDGQPPPPQDIDYEVRRHGGTTTAFDSGSLYQKPSKARSSTWERVIELSLENVRLQHEAVYYAELANGLLRNLLSSLQQAIRRLCRSVSECKTVAEQYRSSAGGARSGQYHHWPDPLQPGGKPDPLPSGDGDSCARKGVQDGLAGRLNAPPPPGMIHPPINQTSRGSKAEALVIKLTRGNGKLRQAIALNRKLVFEVLVRVIRQMQHLAVALRSAIDEGDVILDQANKGWDREISFVARPPTDERLHKDEEGEGSSAASLSWQAHRLEPQGVPENGGVISIPDLGHRRRVLQLECSSYQRLIGEVLVQVVPAIESHSNELLSVITEYSSRDRNTRNQFREKAAS